MKQWLEIDQDEKALTGEDCGLKCRSPWKSLEPCTSYQEFG